MESWQRTHITGNLYELISLTNPNSEMVALLRARDIFSDEDVEVLEARRTLHGNAQASSLFYDVLKTREFAYEVLTKALLTCHQSGAAKILIQGMIMNGIIKPLTHLGIPLDAKDFGEIEMKVQENHFKIKEFFVEQNIDEICKIFKDCLPEMDFYEIFVKQHRKFVLADITIPSKPPFYVPRFVSNRIKVDVKIFRTDCPDIFIFKKIARHHLSQLASPNFTASSASQLENLSCRFIWLEREEDWQELVKIATAPLHLINFNAGESGQEFILENTNGHSELLEKFETSKRVYMTETEFVSNQCTETNTRGVCICDTPGMGKTLLLTSIAQGLAAKSPKNVFAFIPLANFFEKIDHLPQKTGEVNDTNILKILQHISPSSHCACLLQQLIINQLIWLDIFFDGFDEIQLEQRNWVKRLMKTALEKFPTVRVYITSRPHMRHDLESTLGVVAHDMLPFNIENQTNFLINYWLNKTPSIIRENIRRCATDCVYNVKENITAEDSEVTGIPLQCMLIAEVYSEEAYAFCKTAATAFRFTSQKICGMYETYIQKRILAVASNDEEADFIKTFHIQHAHKLLFPTTEIYIEEGFCDNFFEKVLKAGIMQKTVEKGLQKLEFVHRTFAEYLLAEYSAGLFSPTMSEFFMHWDDANFLIDHIFLTNESFKGNAWKEFRYSWNWEHPVVVYFLDSLICKTSESPYLLKKVARSVTKRPTAAIRNIVFAACQHDNLHVFRFLEKLITISKNDMFQEGLTTETLTCMALILIRTSNNYLLYKFVELIKHVFQNNIRHVVKSSWLETAVMYGNYNAVSYLLDECTHYGSKLFYKLVEYTRWNSIVDIEKRIGIFYLLSRKYPDWNIKYPDLLFSNMVHIKIINELVSNGADIKHVNCGKNFLSNQDLDQNCNDFHELIYYLLKERKADYLFKPCSSWDDPIPYITENITLLPETIDLIFNISDINIIKDKHRKNLLCRAVRGNKLITLRELVKRGFTPQKCGPRHECLLLEAEEKEIGEYLIEQGLNPNCKDDKGNTPLHKVRQISTAKCLMQLGADIFAKNNKGDTVLHSQCKASNIDVLKYLVSHGVNVNERNRNGRTPLCFCNKLETLTCLVDLGADIRLKTFGQKSLLHVVVDGDFQQKENIIKYLVNKGLNINDKDSRGKTPLNYCRDGDLSDVLVNELGAKLADINARAYVSKKFQWFLNFFKR